MACTEYSSNFLREIYNPKMERIFCDFFSYIPVLINNIFKLAYFVRVIFDTQYFISFETSA